ncbi:MAG: hypothetical protein ABSD92_14475, partial [Candidatus Bathyarchaeia archaeon]
IPKQNKSQEREKNQIFSNGFHDDGSSGYSAHCIEFCPKFFPEIFGRTLTFGSILVWNNISG